MSQVLQSKVHLLAILLAAFTLLSVPMFMQLRDDTAEAIPHAKETFFSQMFKDAAEQFKDQKLDPDEQIEDAWSQQAKQNNPACQGSLCDSNGDLDGDGASNGDELKNGTNPACDEAKNGDEYCTGADRFNVTSKPGTDALVRLVLLFNRTFAFAANAAPFQDTFQAREDFLQMDVHVNITDFQGVNWEVTVSNPETQESCPINSNGAIGQTEERRKCSMESAPRGSYNVHVSGFATQGNAQVIVYGIANGS